MVAMPIPRAVARFNRYVTNPVQRLWAGRLPGLGIIEHTGRKSGSLYRTPVNMFETPGGYAVAINYGIESDWVKNLLAAGAGAVVYRGVRIPVTDPTILTGEEALAMLPAVPRTLVRGVLRVDTVMRLTASSA
jgi:deazaflavin-dependent oxidoreductase (nitroreductase family)